MISEMLIDQNKEDRDEVLQDFMFMIFAVVLIGGGILWGGPGAGAVAAGIGYEIQAEAHMRILDEDLKDGKITRQSYDIQKDQIQSGSLLK